MRTLRAIAAVWLVVALVPLPAVAAPPVPAAPAPPPSRPPIEVRLSLSPAAADSLSELRVRRLLGIELRGLAALSPEAGGPLGDHVVYVWIDLPDPTTALIEARAGERPVGRRRIRVANLGADVAARLVVITASELVRVQTRPVRPRRPAPPPKPSAEEIERAARTAPALTWSAGGAVAFLPSEGGVLAGPGAELAFRAHGAGGQLFTRWLTGPTAAGGLRWFEVGLGADYRLWQSPSFRFVLGSSAAFASLHLSSVRAVDAIAGTVDTWSARAGANLGAELRVGESTWLGLSASPSLILRPAPYEDAAGQRGTLGGTWLGVHLSLLLERRLFAKPVPVVNGNGR